jgi:hypothetical protein
MFFCKTLRVFLLVCFIINNFPAPIYSSTSINPILKYGKIIEEYQGKSDKLIYVIEDLHCDPKVQKNIFHIINCVKIQHKNNLSLIGVEGSFGKINPSILNKFVNQKNKDKAIKFLLNNGYMNGAELFAFKYPSLIKLYGIENEKLYTRDFYNLLNALENRKKIEWGMNKLKVVLNELEIFLSDKIIRLDSENAKLLQAVSFCKMYISFYEKYFSDNVAYEDLIKIKTYRERFYAELNVLDYILLDKKYFFSSLDELKKIDLGIDNFYDLVLKRDKIMVNNIVKINDWKKHDVSAIIVGGFHKNGVTECLRNRGISYKVIMPNVGRKYDGKIYEKRLKEQLLYCRDVACNVSTKKIITSNISKNYLALISLYMEKKWKYGYIKKVMNESGLDDDMRVNLLLEILDLQKRKILGFINPSNFFTIIKKNQGSQKTDSSSGSTQDILAIHTASTESLEMNDENNEDDNDDSIDNDNSHNTSKQSGKGKRKRDDVDDDTDIKALQIPQIHTSSNESFEIDNNTLIISKQKQRDAQHIQLLTEQVLTEQEVYKKFFEIIITGNVEDFVIFLLSNIIDLNKQINNYLPLCVASDKNYLLMVKIMLDNGARINEIDSFSNNALSYAISRGFIKLVLYLIQKGALIKTSEWGNGCSFFEYVGQRESVSTQYNNNIGLNYITLYDIVPYQGLRTDIRNTHHSFIRDSHCPFIENLNNSEFMNTLTRESRNYFYRYTNNSRNYNLPITTVGDIKTIERDNGLGNFKVLPNEILAIIYSEIDPLDLSSLLRTTKYIYSMCMSSENDFIWGNLCFKSFENKVVLQYKNITNRSWREIYHIFKLFKFRIIKGEKKLQNNRIARFYNNGDVEIREVDTNESSFLFILPGNNCEVEIFAEYNNKFFIIDALGNVNIYDSKIEEWFGNDGYNFKFYYNFKEDMFGVMVENKADNSLVYTSSFALDELFYAINDPSAYLKRFFCYVAINGKKICFNNDTKTVTLEYEIDIRNILTNIMRNVFKLNNKIINSILSFEVWDDQTLNIEQAKSLLFSV